MGVSVICSCKYIYMEGMGLPGVQYLVKLVVK